MNMSLVLATVIITLFITTKAKFIDFIILGLLPIIGAVAYSMNALTLLYITGGIAAAMLLIAFAMLLKLDMKHSTFYSPSLLLGTFFIEALTIQTSSQCNITTLSLGFCLSFFILLYIGTDLIIALRRN